MSMTPPPAGRDFWVFGYGSLMWNPGFPYEESLPALIHGFHRAFCVYSIRYRGTEERPGLVLGLDRGGSCRGIAFRVAAANVEETIAYLNDRELTTHTYDPRDVPARTAKGQITVRTFVVNHNHPQYAGKLAPELAAQMIAESKGRYGACREYLENTVRHLDELGIRDGPIHALLMLVRARTG
jgi:cation transport protein ChaC